MSGPTFVRLIDGRLWHTAPGADLQITYATGGAPPRPAIPGLLVLGGPTLIGSGRRIPADACSWCGHAHSADTPCPITACPCRRHAIPERTKP